MLTSPLESSVLLPVDGRKVVQTALLLPVPFENPAAFLPELVEDQAQTILSSLSAILSAHGIADAEVRQCKIHVVGLKRLADRIRRVVERHFDAGLPALSWLGVSELERGALVGMEFIAIGSPDGAARKI